MRSTGKQSRDQTNCFPGVLKSSRTVSTSLDAPTGPVIHATAVVESGAIIGHGVRIWHFAHVRAGAVIGSGSQLGKSVYVDAGVVIGSRCHIQNFVSLYAGVELADDVFVGPSAVFTNDRFPRAHNLHWELTPTRVGTGASIGANATILCGTIIGPWAMVGAGAVVTRDVRPHQLVHGNPARPRGWVCFCGALLPAAPSDCCTHT